VLFVSLSVAASLTLGGQAAIAQQSGSGAALDEIVVTARKRGAESVQDIPISISAIGENRLRLMNVADFEDFAYQVPGLTFNDTGPGERRYIIRGIQSAGQQQVAVYYDEVALPGVQSSTSDSGSQTPDLKLFDIERVEVLRGPQGTTFGANSQSGTVRIITNKPDLTEFGGSATAEVSSTASSSDNNYEISGVLNLPIIENRLGLRLVAYDGQDGGYIDNRRLSLEDINSVDTTGVRASLRWQATDTLTIDGMFWYQDRMLAGDNRYHPFDSYGQFPGSDQGDLDSVAPITLFETGKFIVGDYTQTFKPDEQTIVSLTANAELPFGDLTVAASTYDRDFGFKFDSTWIILFLGAAGVRDDLFPALTDQSQNLEQEQFEIRLSSRGESPLQWVVGGFYRNRDSQFQSFVPVTNEDGLVFDPGTPFTGNSSEVGAGIPGCHPCVFARFAEKGIEETAFFGELSYTFADVWEATVGVRRFGVDQDEIGATLFQFALFPGDIPPLNTVAVDEDQTITKIGLNFRPSDSLTVYATRSEGFRLGGTNNQGIVAVPELFASDELVNYEIGTKTQWLDGRLAV
ncbi:MAG: TonB-dependent receptor, partial [Woeseiaceae bacterium]